MDCDLPTEFDVIVIGTGIVESVVSAAASRIGKRVLHIDNNNYYGGVWASFNLDSIQNYKPPESGPVEPCTQLVEQDEEVLPVGNDLFSLKDFEVEWHIPDKFDAEENNEGNGDGVVQATEKKWCKESVLKDSRRFNIDLTPKLQFARGEFVELLVSSNIARYSEYRSVSRVLTWLHGQLETVPCSRSDVFANNKVSVIEKRILMKLFVALDGDGQEYDGYENKSFYTFLKDKKLSPNLIHYVLYAIAMSNDDTGCLEGIQNTKRFLNSLGRFGKTPFLFSMYGSGEITQGFCRLSAVFGGIYALSQPLNGLIFNKDGQFKGLLTGKQRINAEVLILGVDKSPTKFIGSPPKSYISRAVFITDKSIVPSEKEHLTLLLYPPENGKHSCVIIELGSLTGTCPKDFYIVHLTAKQQQSPKEDFQHCVENLFSKEEDAKPKVLWSCYFSVPETSTIDFKSVLSRNTAVCPGPDLDLDYDNSIKIAKDIFNEIYPGTDFLPRAPDPEEIIIEGDADEDDVVLKPEHEGTENNEANEE